MTDGHSTAEGGAPAPHLADSDPFRAEAMRRMERELVLMLRKMRATMEQLAREVHPELEAPAYGILRMLATGDAGTVTELAAQLGVGKPTVSRQVTGLEQLGLIQRGSATEDRRAVPLQLTGDGRARLERARGDRDARFRRLLADWSIDEVSTLGELLAKLNRISL